MREFVLDPYINDIANFLNAESDQNGATWPELERIAWHAYLSSGVIDHVEYDQIRHHFPDFRTDPECNDPVLAISIGKHYKDNYYGNAEGEFIDESDFQALHREINQETKHFGGELTPGFTVAWAGMLLGLRDCKEITDAEYEQLMALLPVLENNPVREVEAFTNKWRNLA